MSEIFLFADGSCYPVPRGNISIGIVIEDGGKIIHSLAENTGILGTAEVAELVAVQRALEEAVRINAKQIVVYSDSQSVVNKLNDKDKPKNRFSAGVYCKIIHFLDKFENIRFEWINRKQNRLANVLSRRGQDQLISIPRVLQIKNYTFERFNEIFFVTKPKFSGKYFKVDLVGNWCSCSNFQQNQTCEHLSLLRSRLKKE